MKQIRDKWDDKTDLEGGGMYVWKIVCVADIRRKDDCFYQI
jgi:hypothetical protein